jgi:predicted RNase H-like nuclease (RuvC/YqgF family)
VSFEERDRIVLESAIAEVGYKIPLNGVRELDAAGVADVLRRAVDAMRAERAVRIRESAARERTEWLLDCAKKDVADEQARYEQWRARCVSLDRQVDEMSKSIVEMRSELERLYKPAKKRRESPSRKGGG